MSYEALGSALDMGHLLECSILLLLGIVFIKICTHEWTDLKVKVDLSSVRG